MSVRAVIFDVYGTLLEVGPAPADADLRWSRLWRELLGAGARLTRLEFSVACSQVIARHHAFARARGIPWPEVIWPSVVSEVVPELEAVPVRVKDEFIQRQIQTGHTTRLSAETGSMLRQLSAGGLLLGIASNAQAYTLKELEVGLSGHGLTLELFERSLCFWSFEHGFSKPDPHAFQILSARLASRGIAPEQTLMVGDRMDNDIEPARRHGWQACEFPAPGRPGHGDWRPLIERTRSSLA